MVLLCVDLPWHFPCAQDTGRETGIFETGTEVAVVIEMNIMEGLATIDLHTSALDSTAVGLTVTAIAPHLTVCSIPHLLTGVCSHTSAVFGRISLKLFTLESQFYFSTNIMSFVA